MQIVAIFLALITFASFVWAIRHVFVVPGGQLPQAMRLLSGLGLFCFLLQLLLLVRSGGSAQFGLGLLGVLLYGASFFLFWWAIPHARRSGFRVAFVQHTPTSVVSSGPYGIIRHPLYASYLLYWIAGATFTQELVLLLSVAVMGVLYARAIRQEEAEFELSLASAEYHAYKERTPALVPSLRKRSIASPANSTCSQPVNGTGLRTVLSLPALLVALACLALVVFAVLRWSDVLDITSGLMVLPQP